uniref:DBF4-type domain-containing protein n=1 Tax=Iconisemion striatum TaxID=60296 RepID=A0A1A7Y239_9TELE
MSHSSVEDEQRGVELTSKMWAEPEPGPSRCQPSRQGYCGYCRVLYTNLEQHLSSLRHLDSVRTSSRGSTSVSSTWSRLTLLERFLQDVLQHHPHRYSDPRPSHADLPSVSTPPLPRTDLDDVFVPKDDSLSSGIQEHLPSSGGASCQPARHEEHYSVLSQSRERAHLERLSSPVRDQNHGGAHPAGPSCLQHHKTLSPHAETPPPHSQAPPSVYRKAHRKTNRRKPSESSSSSRAPRGPGFQPHQQETPRAPGGLRSQSPTEPKVQFHTGPKPQAPSGLRAWLTWQRERREAQKEETFSSDHTDLLEQTIEEVIQACCHQQEETASLNFSFPVSMETQSEDWDSPVQVVFQKAGTLGETPVQVIQTEGQDVNQLMEIQLDMEDQMYSEQLDSALLGLRVKKDEGFWTLPIEEVLPVPEHIPESFRGKTWAQIEREDEEKVDKLVQRFRRGRFICYFDTESLARYGRRSQKKKELTETMEAEPDTGVLPLMEGDDDESVCVRKRKRRSLRLASRCQVVKVSHSTQTVQLVVPAVHQLSAQAPPTSIPAASQRTPESWRFLPSSYSNIVTPVQQGTSLVYLLCSPSSPTPLEGSTSKNCRKRLRPVDRQGLKVKYKRLPVHFYEPRTNRILKKPPKGLLWYRGSTSMGPPPPCVRKLFRSLSPDLNTDKQPGAAPKVDLSTLCRTTSQTDRRRGKTSQATPLHNRSERERGRRPRLPTSKRRSRVQAPPPKPRREGLRSSGPAQPPSRRGRGQRGRGCEKGCR